MHYRADSSLASNSGFLFGFLSAVMFFLLALPLVQLSAQQEQVDVSDQLPAALDRRVDYLKEIKPLLQRSCYSCHGQEKQEGGLRLDVRRHALQGGDQGAVIIAGKAGASSLLALVAGLDEERGLSLIHI